MSATTETDRDFVECEECSAPVERDQRYCLTCGTHRRDVPDPASRYFGEASAARTRVLAAQAARAAAGPRRRRLPRFSARFLVVLVIAAAAIGFGIGSSTGGGGSVAAKTAAAKTTPSSAKKCPSGSATGTGYAKQEDCQSSVVAEP